MERDASTRQVLRKPNYVISCDVAEGLAHGDRSSIVVINANTTDVVAAYRGHWPIEDLDTLLAWLGYWYHSALIVVERNNFGILPLENLRKAHYPRLFRMDKHAEIKGLQGRSPKYGYITSRATKPKLIRELAQAIRDENIGLADERFCEEAQTFVSDGRGSYSASAGAHDDHVMSLGICWQGALEVGHYPLVWTDNTVTPITLGELADIQLRRRLSQLASPLDSAIGRDGKTRTGTDTVAFYAPT